jgi:hypothetical protein
MELGYLVFSSAGLISLIVILSYMIGVLSPCYTAHLATKSNSGILSNFVLIFLKGCIRRLLPKDSSNSSTTHQGGIAQCHHYNNLITRFSINN